VSSASSLEAIQGAIYTRLSGDATLLTLCDGVLNYEPEEPPQKFIVIGNATEQAWHTLGGTSAGWGWDATVTVHIYSYYKGDLEALRILGRVTALLNFYELSVSGYTTVICEYGEKLTKSMVETKNKQERRHIPAVFSIKVHE
jgi:hypothetical protein